MEEDKYPDYVPTITEEETIQEVLKTLDKGRGLLTKSFNYFNNRSLLDVVDDWTKRWNGYLPPMNPLLDQAHFLPKLPSPIRRQQCRRITGSRNPILRLSLRSPFAFISVRPQGRPLRVGCRSGQSEQTVNLSV